MLALRSTPQLVIDWLPTRVGFYPEDNITLPHLTPKYKKKTCTECALHSVFKALSKTTN